MTDEQNERAALANEARLDAKAFRENTVYDSDGNSIRLIANADRLDQYADRIEALEAENARLREAVGILEDGLQEVGDDYPGSSCQEWCQHQIKQARAALKDTRND